MNVSKQQRLDGKVAIVTGGAGLLGPEFGSALAEQGADVILVDVSPDRLDRAVKTVAAFGTKVVSLCADVADPKSVAAMVADVIARFGKVDVLVNGAAGRAPGFFTSFEEYALSDWNAVVSANLTGTFLCCQAVGRELKKGGGGSIINTSSIYGVVAPDQRIYEGSTINTPAVYSASKAGVIGLTQYLATYWAKDNIRVNALTPGGMFNGQEAEFVRRYESRTPLGRMGRPHELRGALVFLASEMASYVTGHNLVVDGGWTVW